MNRTRRASILKYYVTESKEEAMKWLRCRPRARSGFGTLDGTAMDVLQGNLFEQPQPTGERLDLAAIE